MTLAAQEIVDLKWAECDGDGVGIPVWRGARTFTTTEATAVADIAALMGTAFPDVDTTFATVSVPFICNKIRAIYRPNGLSGIVRLVAMYGPLALRNKRKAGRARVREYSTEKLRKVTKDPADAANIIEGPDPAGPVGAFWEVIDGQNHIPDDLSLLMVSTAYPKAAFDANTIQGVWGKYNSDDLTITGFGTIGAKRLLISHYQIDTGYGDPLVDVDYAFWKTPPDSDRLWDKRTLSQKFAPQPVQVDEYAADGTTVIGKKTIRMNRPVIVGGAIVTAQRNIALSASYAFLQGLTTW